MASKKVTLLAVLVMVVGSSAFAQLGGVLDYQDSTKIKSKKLPQFNEWKSNSKSNFFPPVPRAMGQLSLNAGLVLLDGDCPTNPGFNVGVSYRKALGYVVSLRAGFNYAQARGLDYRRNGNLGNSQALQVYRLPNPVNPSVVGPGWYVHSFQSTLLTPSLDLIFNLNNIMFHRKSSKFAFYGLVGYTPTIYRTKLDALAGARPYGFNTLNDAFFERPRKEIRSDLKDFFDGDYETFANVNDRSPNFNNSGNDRFQIRHSINVGLGTEFRIARRMSLGFELKQIFTRDDYIDGWFLNNGGLTPDKDNLLFSNLFINFNL
ncbi:MAG: hypothetical protein MUF62_04100 [Chitinophagaceae bacterium]|nr:hypothetical protein [Chitinophagaceae bacterium]